MNLKQEVLQDYPNIDSRIENFLDRIVNELNTRNIASTNYTKIILSMLVVQLMVYYKSYDDMNSANNVSSKDAYNRTSKSPAISIMQTAHDKILNLMDKICLSPLSSAKVYKLQQNDINKEIDAETAFNLLKS